MGVMKHRLEPGVAQHLAETVKDLVEDGEMYGALGASACVSLNSIAISAKRQADALDRIAERLEMVTDHFNDGAVRVRTQA